MNLFEELDILPCKICNSKAVLKEHVYKDFPIDSFVQCACCNQRTPYVGGKYQQDNAVGLWNDQNRPKGIHNE